MSARGRRPVSRAEVIEEFRTGSIHEAALRVITRKGLAATTMADVAAEAGVSRPTIYLYFRDREELLERTALMVFGELGERLTAALAAARTAEEKLRANAVTHMTFFQERREFFRTFIETCGDTGRTKHKKQYEQYLAVLAGVLADGMARGEVRRADPRRLAVIVAEALRAVVRQRLTETVSPDPAEDAELVMGVLLHGLATEDSKA